MCTKWRGEERKCLKSVKTAAETVRTKGGGEFVSTKKSGKTNYGSYKKERKLFSALARERENRLAKNVLRKRERQLSGRSDN